MFDALRTVLQDCLESVDILLVHDGVPEEDQAEIERIDPGPTQIVEVGYCHAMDGYVLAGDELQMRLINHNAYVQFGECYYIVTRADELKVLRFVDEHEDPNYFKLRPHREDMLPQDYPKSAIKEMWLVTGLMRRIAD